MNTLWLKSTISCKPVAHLSSRKPDISIAPQKDTSPSPCSHTHHQEAHDDSALASGHATYCNSAQPGFPA